MAEEVFVVNPESGTGDHVPNIRERAADREADVRISDAPGDARDLAREAAGGGTVVAVGGDGTVNEVVRGIVAADALGTTTLGLIPAGTGNDFARNLGIEGIEHGFDRLDRGERRLIDLGWANERPFLNSCIAGITAEASGRTSPDRKSRFGVLAYVLTTIETASDFRGLAVEITLGDGETWSGEAGLVLVGNGRQLNVTGGTQAPMEDGRLDVVIVEDPTGLDLGSGNGLDRLLGSDRPDVIRRRVAEITVGTDDDEIPFSLDGEMVSHASVRCRVDPRVLRVVVGEAYDPDPA